MGWREEQRERDEAIRQELVAVRERMEELSPAVRTNEPPAPAERVLHRFPGLAVSLRLCRDYESGKALLHMLKPVPREHNEKTIRSGPWGLEVRCPCDAWVVPQVVTRLLAPCAGCDRWYVGDESGVWSVRLPGPREVCRADEVRDAA